MTNEAINAPDHPAIELLTTRRSALFSDLHEPGPSVEQLDTLLRIAARVPDHGKLVPWRFIVIEGEARKKIGDVAAASYRADNAGADPEKIDFERRRFGYAPLIVAVVSRARPHPKSPQWEQALSAGASCMALITAATAMGFDAAWLTGWAASDRRILDVLGLLPQERLVGFVHIGTAKTKLPDRARPDLADIVTRL